MFKKRTLLKESAPTDKQTKNDNTKTFFKRPLSSGIDLRKDIEQMEGIITTNQQRQAENVHKKRDDDQQEEEKPQHSHFKTKKINKFTSHILKNLPTRTVQTQVVSHPLRNPIIQAIPSTMHPIDEVNIQQSTSNANNQLVRPILNNYGLLDKSHFKSNEGNIIQASKGHQQALMDYYVKKKMQEIAKSNVIAQEKTQGVKARQPEAWQEVLQIQKQYLTQEEKIKEYSVEELQRKLEKLAHDSIRAEVEKRAVYLRDLLENEHERMEYASKKELKIVKQDRERIERELNSKYKDSGRRHFVESIKNSVL